MLECDIEYSDTGSHEIDVLSDISLLFDSENIDIVNLIASYKQQLKKTFDSLDLSQHKALSRLSYILLEGLDRIVEEKRNLTADERLFLKKIPDILSEFVFIPTSKIPDVHFLNHFKNPLWIRPVTSAEEKEIIELLTVDTCSMNSDSEDKLSSDECSIVDCDENIDLSNHLETTALQMAISDNEMQELDIDIDIEEERILEIDSKYEDNFIEEIPSEDASIKVDSKHEDIDNCDGPESISFEDDVELADLLASNHQTDLEDNEISNLDNQHADDLQIENIDVSDNDVRHIEGIDLPVSINENTVSLEEGISDTDSEIDLMELLDQNDDNLSNEKINEEEVANVYSIDPEVKSSINISEDQQELIQLVSDELEEIIDNKEFTVLNKSSDKDELEKQLINIAEEVENISNAVDLIGLEGLGNTCRYLSSNIHMFALSGDINDGQEKLLALWPVLILSYLQNIANASVVDELIIYLKKPGWPDPISSELEQATLKLLNNPQFKDDEKTIRQNMASAGDMSLALPEDVNPELLEGLLQDLPVQTEEFSNAIQSLQNQSDLSYLETAQRIAHTLKGAGNVVGVKGIANLTHHLEDILETQYKAGKLPSKDLLEVLIDAADCMETMCEALLGIDEPPDNALSVFQSVLDWANILDLNGATDPEQGATVDHGAITADVSLLTEDSIGDKSQKSSVSQINIENMLRVPARLADELLRLAGENMISTSQIQEYIKNIQNRYKTLKTHNLSLQKLSFDLEHIVDVQGIVSSNDRVSVDNDFDPLELDQYHELHSMSRRLVEVAADSIELTQVLEKDLAQLQAQVITQDRLQKENEELVLRTRMVPTKTIIARLKRGVKQACRLTNKNVDLDVYDNDTYMDSEVLNSLIDPLMHILRNAVDHGIESYEERIKSGKNTTGTIKLIFSRRGDQIVIDVKDDGKGLSLEHIRNKAVSMGLVTSAQEITEENIQKYILQPGLSTRDQVSQISGRGIGLDVVNSKIRELKGSIEISSIVNQGCRFLLTLPISSFSIHSLLVRVRDEIYAISNRGIEEIFYPGLGELQEVANETVFKLDDKIYNTEMIESLLNMPQDRRESERGSNPIVLVKGDTGISTAVIVQEVIDSRNVVVKSMGPYIPKIPGIVGATVLGDGSIAPVIDLPELMQSELSVNRRLDDNEQLLDMSSVSRLPYVLVVDDSLSARKSLAQFVQDLGLDVRTARDGMEAVSLIDARKPDLILVDMEMPRMNGLELTSHIRASENTQDMPVIMITSRSTDKHRKTAMDKGVNHYMVKPFAEDELASHINLALKIA